MTLPRIPAAAHGALVLRRAAEGDHLVVLQVTGVGTLVAGRILLTPRSFGREVWLWTITGPSVGLGGPSTHGEALTLAEAKAAFREALDAVLAAAGEGGVAWHPGAMGRERQFDK